MLIRRCFIIFFVLISAAFAADYLVRIDLDEQRLDPLFENGLRPIAELDNTALLIVTDNELGRLTPYSFSIIDEDPEEGRYYLAHRTDEHLALTDYGEILMTDGSVYLLKIRPDMLEELIKEKVDIQRLMFSPIIRSSQRASKFYYNPLVQTIVDQVDPDSVLSVVQRLQDFVTRYSTHDSCDAAADYIAGKFTDYGCDSVYFQYHTTGHAPNVVGVKTGTLYPDSIYTVVCGHFDATSYLSPNIAPGADDNASGTASVIEAIRVMRNYQFEYSVRYIAFSGEEFGLYGSYYYASLARSQGDSILGVLNADMIAYVNAYPESVEVLAKISNPPCEPFADFFVAAADSYTTLLARKRMVTSAAYSDHHPFWQNGYLAVCNIEDNPLVNPYYHEPGDTIGAGYNDNAFCTEVVKAQVAALSLMARPLATAYLTMPDYWIVDTAPGGNGNGMWESGEEVDLVIQIYNMGVDTAKNTYGVINNTSPYVTLLEDSCYVGNVLSQETTEMSFRISAAASVPLGYETNFDLNVVCNTGNWDYSLEVFINPLPSLSFCDYAIIDANGILEPGETADLVITLANVGAASAQNVTTTLTSNSSYLTIIDNSGNFGQITVGDTIDNASDPFTVTASASAPYGVLVACELVVVAGLYVDTLDFDLAIGEPVP
ncbi:MAG: M28 family peptidase, partial [candidate division WOR-3 bacterium]